jgi:hypothetical protein
MHQQCSAGCALQQACTSTGTYSRRYTAPCSSAASHSCNAATPQLAGCLYLCKAMLCTLTMALLLALSLHLLSGRAVDSCLAVHWCRGLLEGAVCLCCCSLLCVQLQATQGGTQCVSSCNGRKLSAVAGMYTAVPAEGVLQLGSDACHGSWQ